MRTSRPYDTEKVGIGLTASHTALRRTGIGGRLVRGSCVETQHRRQANRQRINVLQGSLYSSNAREGSTEESKGGGKKPRKSPIENFSSICVCET